ncbi:TonB-dependent receptor [Halosquirtibacter laminarini]|uniref:TonB-dependent receptor n=1 Tax=Halosquirtibacter laminarini TaxID=3374600 RepID=A0AC61NCN7_9BACT|nr:TonB-dependent receptor [Prolixibacteraceae bacterium]
MNRKLTTIVLILLLCHINTMATCINIGVVETIGQQSKRRWIKGVITDPKGETLPGANVIIKGTTKGVITGVDGSYEILVTNEDELIFSFIGFDSKIVKVGSKMQLNVQLSIMHNELEDITIVAFGKQKKESVIGSITTVKPSELKVPSSNLTTALAGRMSGVISYQRSGEPGQDNAEFFIRGVTTFGYKKDPLILVDHNEVSSTELSKLHPDDIASFSIMKDATATALYGSRGANGVILVTTKEGKEGKAQINVRLEESMSMPTQKVKLADPIQYMYLHNEAIKTRDPLRPAMYSETRIDRTKAGVNPDVYPTTNWYDELFKNYALNKRMNLNISGGGKVARYYVAGSLSSDNGLLKVDPKNNFNSNIDLKRYMLRSNVNISVTKTTKVNVRLQGAFDDYTGPIDGGSAIYGKVLQSNPVLFPAFYKPDDKNKNTQHILFGNAESGNYNNPYADMVKGYKNYTTSNMSAQFELHQDLDFLLKGLSLRGIFNTSRYSYFDVSRFYNPFLYKIATYDEQSNDYSLELLNQNTGTEYLNYKEGKKNVNSTTYFEGAINWSNTFGKHSFGTLLVGTMRQHLTANAGDLQKSLPYKNISIAGRSTYSYDSKYFIEVNFGYNGSERFSKKERFGFFPSAGLSWMVSNEPFWKSNLSSTFNKFKFKATYGISGNDAIGSANDRFFYLSNVNLNDSNKGASFGTEKGYHNNGVSISRYANDNITWETAKKLNLGTEIGLWNSLELQVDLFQEKRNNILMTRSSIPTTMGLQASSRANVGEASSKGIDLSLNLNHSFNNDFWLTAMGNFTYAKSQFDVYEEPSYANTPWRSRIGYSLNQTWGYVAERLFIDASEIKNSPTQIGNYMAGDIKYKDINGDGKITEMDKVPLGYPTSPEIVYGFGFSFGYKGFDFNCFFQGLDRESFWINADATSPFINNQSALLAVYADDHWSEDNRNSYALWPRLSDEKISNNLQTSSWFMRDGAFLRLKSLEIGYSLPQNLISKVKLNNLRIYLSGTNLLTFSKFKLWDPEMGGNGFAYPVQKVYNLGLKFTF